MTEKKLKRVLEVIEYYLSQLGMQPRSAPPSRKLLTNLERILKKHSINEVKKAVNAFAKSPWWQEHFKDAAPEWFFKSPERISKILRGKQFITSIETVEANLDRICSLYNWAVVCQFHNHGEMHPFVDRMSKGIQDAVDFIVGRLETIKSKVETAMSEWLERPVKVTEDEAIFIYLVDPFNRSDYPPPLYYYYSQGFFQDFQYKRIVDAFVLMNDWKAMFKLDLQKQPEFVIVPKNKVHEFNPTPEGLKIIKMCEEAFGGKHK